MDLRDWMLIKVLNEEKSTLKAAEAMFITQPAIMYRIRRMETEMGVPLFVGNNKGIHLTSAGERLLSFADKMIKQNDYIKSYVKNRNIVLEGSIKLGTSSSFADQYLPLQLKAFSKIYPSISVSLIIDLNHILARQLNENAIMLAVIRGEHKHKLREFRIYEDPLVIISSQAITPEYLAKMPFIRFVGDPLLLAVVNNWVKENMATSPIMSIESSKGSANCLQLVKAGIGWSIVAYTRSLGCDNIYRKPIHDSCGKLCMRVTRLIYSDFAYNYDVYQAYINHFCEFFSKFSFPSYDRNDVACYIPPSSNRSS